MAATIQSPKKPYKVGLPISSTAMTRMKIAVPIMFIIKRFMIKMALLKFLVVAVNNHLEDLRFTMYKVQFESLATDVACD